MTRRVTLATFFVARTKVDEVVVSALSERELDNEEFAILYHDVMREAENDVRSQTVTELGRLSGIGARTTRIFANRGNERQNTCWKV